MKSEYRRTLIILGTLILIVVNFAFFWLGYYYFQNPILSNFQIYGVKEENAQLVLDMSPSNHATKYKVEVSKEGKKIYENTSETNLISLADLDLEYQEEIDISVIAINKNNSEKQVDHPYHYQNTDASFDKRIDHKLSGVRHLVLNINGYNEEEDYSIELYYQKNEIYHTKIRKDVVEIPYQKVEGYAGRITAYLKNKNGRILSSFNFYLNTPVVGKVQITSPQNEGTTRWNDVDLKFEGGENANHFFINIFENKQMTFSTEMKVDDHTIHIPADYFTPNQTYRLELEAVYEDYYEISEKSSIQIHIGSKEVTQGVYTSHNPNHIKKGTTVRLQTTTKDATIYYTTDGLDPVVYGKIYKNPIPIEEDTTIKTYAVSKNRFSTPIYTYSFHVSDKTPVIYLSPSNQDENYGARNTGFTNEMNMMNKIADVVERVLKENQIIVYRNNPYGNINTWTNQSLSVGADFHFAIHSNASRTQLARGPEIYIDNELSPSFSIASTIYENLWKVYDGNKNMEYHRGIKYARGSLGEASDSYLPCSSLIEVAFHDNPEDASWIANNVEKIGQSLASSIISYYN